MKSFTTDTFQSKTSKRRKADSSAAMRLRRTPLAQAAAILLMAGGSVLGSGNAHAAQPFSAGWFGAMGVNQHVAAATGYTPNGKPASAFNPAAQQQAANTQLQQSIANLTLAAHGIAMMQAQQASWRKAALGNPSTIPNGLGVGGLDTGSLASSWINAIAPTTQTTDANGNIVVDIQQTADKAIANWQTFNVGKNTIVQFDQASADWAILNRITDPSLAPSTIQGQIRAPGTVLIVNKNGIVFSGSSQINVRNLVAAAADISDIQFTGNGIYGLNETASFTDAGGKLVVEAGAQIATSNPTSVTQGGGYVLLMGQQVANAGDIETRQGQVELAAGDNFIIRKGVGTDANTASTTRGNEISPQRNPGSTAGQVINTGLLLAREGDVTLAGHEVRQNGVAMATTTVNTRGTIHLLNSAADSTGQVVLGAGAITAVAIEDDGKASALDSQRDALIKESATQDLLRDAATGGAFDNLAKFADRRDLSRIEIVSGADVNFESDSLTLATGGQIAVSAQNRSFVADRAQLDVAGKVGVQVAMESNNVQINVQGNELRDAPLNRDSGTLFNDNVWIDRRKLIFVPAGTDGYDSDRWYTAGGLLEVGGYLSNQGHGIGEWAAPGGTITLGGKEVVTQAGSNLNISGGTLDVSTGYLAQTWLKGADGQLYSLNDAPADMLFNGVYKGFEVTHARWGKEATQYFYNPLIAPQKRLENGYTVGRDAGRVIVSAPTAVLEGDISADVFNGVQQSRVRDGFDDGYRQAQTAVARPGTLALYGPWNAAGALWQEQPYDIDVQFDTFAQMTRDLVAGQALPAERIGTAWFDSAHLSAQHLGGLDIATLGDITVGQSFTLQHGGAIDFLAADIDLGAAIVAPGGSIDMRAVGIGGAAPEPGHLVMHAGAAIDTRGVWTNASEDVADMSGLAYIDGGSVTLHSAGDLTLEAGSSIDASAGGAILKTGVLRGGAGGDITLSSSMRDLAGNGVSGQLALDGDIRSYGFTKGGKLTLVSDSVVVIDNPAFDLGTTLAAGTVLPIDVTLTGDLLVPAGSPIPVPYQITVDHVDSGVPLPFDVIVQSRSATLSADWTLPFGPGGEQLTYTYFDASGSQQSAASGDVMPQGTTYNRAFRPNGSAGALPAGYVLPADVFPLGVQLASPKSIQYGIGTVLDNDITVAAGTVLGQGAVLPGEAQIEALPYLHLNSDLFSKGFSAYAINGQKGLVVGDGAVIAPVMPLLRFTGASAQVASGGDLYGTLEHYLAPVYTEDVAKARLTQRAGVDLALQSGVEDELNPGQMLGGWVSIGQGAAIRVDPGHDIGIASGGQITVDGLLSAPGGAISVFNLRPLSGAVSAYATDPGALSVWIGEHAVLDAAARAHVAVAADGRRYGVAPDGGSIALGRSVDLTQNLPSTDAAVVIRPGARLDASGSAAIIDVAGGSGFAGPGFAPYAIAGNGGSISASSYNALYLDGDLRAAAGGQGAAGGALSLELELPPYQVPFGESASYIPANLRAARVITVSQEALPSTLPADLAPGAITPAWRVGHAGIGADQIGAGGFDAVSLWGRDGIAFDGDVTLTVGRSLALLKGPVFNTVAGGNATLAAPYLLLDGGTTPSDRQIAFVVPPAYPEGGILSASADLIDVRNRVATSYSSTQLTSRGDLRFLASNDVPLFGVPTTYLAAGADLTLTAQQIYPASGAVVMVSAGPAEGVNASTLKIASVDGSLPPLPYSVFGSISFTADKVEQGGVVRAPMGEILLGSGDRPVFDSNGNAVGYEATTSLLTLQPGSVTSVSAAGLAMPYGGTTDGVTYTADGKPVTTASLIDGRFSWSGNFGTNAVGIGLNAADIDARAGALLDLSGGGLLAGAAFVSGRGGSVDTLLHPRNPGGQVYAILPGVVTAPVAGGYATAWNGDVPGIGRQITLPAGVPGLPAGTYTLLPANYALLPGAFRVELGAQSQTPIGAMALRDGSWLVGGAGGIANTSIHDTFSTQVTVTSGAVLRTYSQYNETGYDAFQQANASVAGALRPLLGVDAKGLSIGLSSYAGSQPSAAPALMFDAKADFSAGEDGYAGSLLLTAGQIRGGEIVFTGPGSNTERTDFTLPVAASVIDQVGAPVLYIGSRPRSTVGSAALSFDGSYKSIRLENGAVLRGAQIVLVSGGLGGDNVITMESGSRIDTLGWGDARVVDSSAGYLFGIAPENTSNGAAALLIASNGAIAMNPPTGGSDDAIVIKDGAAIYAEGSIGFYADKGVSFEGTPLLGARNLALALASINIGEAGSLGAAQAAGVLPAGLNLDQAVLGRILAGSPEAGVPSVENLVLSASQSINFFGTVDLDLRDAGTGKALLDQLVFNTPAIYGLGAAGDKARLSVDTLVWNGNSVPAGAGSAFGSFISAQPGAVLAGGAGTGQGGLEIDARRIVFGYPVQSQTNSTIDFNRLALGFGTVDLSASERIVSNNSGSLLVYMAGSDPAAGFDPLTYTGSGGILNLRTPLLTGDAGSRMRYRSGGALTVAAPADASSGTGDVTALGASIDLASDDSIRISSKIVLPSGKLTLTAGDDVVLADGAQLDLAGRAIQFFDVTRYSWGGDVSVESTRGNIVLEAGAGIDVSGQNSDAGTLALTATDAGHGSVLLEGAIKGSGGEGYDGGAIDLRAQRIGADPAGLSADFAALNTRLNDAGFFGRRSFVLKQGDLAVGDELRAHEVTLSVDGGSLTVNGKIDASGIMPGTIRLAALGDLNLGAGAQLDAHGSQLQVDSYGQVVEAKNRGAIELTSSKGWLRLAPGASMDLSSPDGIARGRIELNAGRSGGAGGNDDTVGDVRIDAGGPLAISGAGSVALNAFWSYSPTDADGSIVQDNGGADPVNNGAVGLNQIDTRTMAFMQAALANGDLGQRMGGLSSYGSAFHLRPGVEIVSATPDGNLTVVGDLDLSGYRYGLDADRNIASPSYGAGEPLSLVVRAGGNLTVKGSITDGFAPPAATPYDTGAVSTQSLFVGGQAAASTITFVPPYNPNYGEPLFLFPATDPNSLASTDAPTVLTGSISDAYHTYGPGSVIPGFLEGTVTVEAGTTLSTVDPVNSIITADVPVLGMRQIWPSAPLLAAGSMSASIRLASGADLGAADTRTLRAANSLSGAGNMRLSGAYLDGLASVIRTGTGNLDLLAGGNFSEDGLYGVYTAGTQSPLAVGNTDYDGLGTYYPDHGGNLLVAAQGNLTGISDDAFVGNWLWRQGSNEDGIKTAWSINFGAYTTDRAGVTAMRAFSGFGALGGGNVTVLAGKDAGSLDSQGGVTTGLVVAVGSTGRVTSVSTAEDGSVTGGTLVETGGGDVTVRIGGLLNPVSGVGDIGVFTDLRGDISISAGAIGALPLQYGVNEIDDPRPVDPYTAAVLNAGHARGGVVVVPGDSHVVLRSRGDLLLDGVGDATQFERVAAGAPVKSWFTLWQPTTSIELFSAGGNLAPSGGNANTTNVGWLDPDNLSLSMLPAQVYATAAGGSIYFGGGNLMLAPSASGQLEILARQSIYGGARFDGSGPLDPSHISMSGADAGPDAIPNPFKPATLANATQRNYEQGFFVFETNTVTGNLHQQDPDPIRIYAADGDLVNVVLGEQRIYIANGAALEGYYAAKFARILAGRDIVGFGNGFFTLGDDHYSPSVIVNANADDVSIIAAGRDMFHTNVVIAGPGTLEVSAGRNLYQGDDGMITSIGPLVVGDARPGASIVLQAGVGVGGPDYRLLAARYLDPANLADPGMALADQPGKAAKTYEAELGAWLKDRYGFEGGSTDALAYFDALAADQQRVFLRQVYFDELREGGREYNNPDSKRFGSYLRGREMIATLFPNLDANGNAIERSGDITMFGGAGVRTQFGGDIQMFAPAGQIVVGVQGQVPPSTSGIVTQGQGDIQIYSEQSLLLGLSRIMTTFGGDILAWSAQGDINAGRGSKTTLVYTPPKRVYDDFGNVTLAPDVPSTGAGIATLNPIPEVPAGDVDLIAPLGTIDAGEAGIRVSGNVNLAALQVVNAANIVVQGKATGVPTLAAVNVGALANAGAAATQAAMAAQDVVSRERNAARQALPSIFTVRVLSFGNEPAPAPKDKDGDTGDKQSVSYDPSSTVRVLGVGELPETARRQLTARERSNLGGL